MNTKTDPAPIPVTPGWSSSLFFRFAIRKHGKPLAATVLVVIFLAQLLGSGGDFSRLQYAVFDLYQRMNPRQMETFPVAIVDIDEKSLSKFGQWPWPRTLLARLIENIHARGALVIGLDIILPEPDRLSPQEFAAAYPDIQPGLKSDLEKLPSNDEILANTLKRIPVVVGRAAIDKPTSTSTDAPITPAQVSGGDALAFLTSFPGHLTNVSAVNRAAAGFGYLNASLDPDGVARRMPVALAVDGKIAPSMGLELIRVALGANWFTVNVEEEGITSVSTGEVEIETDPQGRIALHFSGAKAQRRVSALDVLSGQAPKDAFAGQIALIGVTGLGLADVATTPISPRIDGVEIQAQFIENLLFGSRLKRTDLVLTIESVALYASGLLLIFLMPLAGPLYGLSALLALLVAQFGSGFWAFNQYGLLLDPAYPAIGSIAVFLALMLTHVTEADRNKRLLRAQLEIERLENARMGGELAAARDIQMGILPDPKSIKGIPDNLLVHAFLEPAREVGGDFYDLFMVDEYRLYFIIGDVSGKGVPASLFMALSKALCKSAVLRKNASVAELMVIANSEISRENPAYMFVTGVAGIIDSRTGDIEFCNAGHDNPFVVGPGKTVHQLESVGGPPLCVMDDFPYPVEYAKLEPGEMLVLTTDGINEAMTADDQMYGNKRMAELLDSLPGDCDPEAAIQTLYDDVKTFVADADPNDDITVLALKFLQHG